MCVQELRTFPPSWGYVRQLFFSYKWPPVRNDLLQNKQSLQIPLSKASSKTPPRTQSVATFVPQPSAAIAKPLPRSKRLSTTLEVVSELELRGRIRSHFRQHPKAHWSTAVDIVARCAVSLNRQAERNLVGHEPVIGRGWGVVGPLTSQDLNTLDHDQSVAPDVLSFALSMICAGVLTALRHTVRQTVRHTVKLTHEA